MPIDKTIYNYSSTTFEFTTVGEGDVYEEDPNTVVVPGNATQIAPPSTGAHQVAVFNPNLHTWSVQQDFRGEARYSTATGAPVSITQIGALPPNTTDKPKPSSNHVWDAGLNDWKLDTSLEDAAHNLVVMADLAAIDLRSIAPLREWVATQPSASQDLLDIEAEAVTKRAELR